MSCSPLSRKIRSPPLIKTILLALNQLTIGIWHNKLITVKTRLNPLSISYDHLLTLMPDMAADQKIYWERNKLTKRRTATHPVVAAYTLPKLRN